MTTLVYIGANQGHSLWDMFDKYDRVYAFEPDPEMFYQLNKRFRQFEWVTLVNAACSFEDGEADLYVTPNRVSSSLSNVNVEEYGGDPAIKKVKIKTVNLLKYIEENNIESIDYYYSDCQGSDFNILSTIKKYIDLKKINKLYVETHNDGVFLYEELNNQFSSFKNLLSENYNFVYASLGRLSGKIVEENDIPKNEIEWDSYWEVKS